MPSSKLKTLAIFLFIALQSVTILHLYIDRSKLLAPVGTIDIAPQVLVGVLAAPATQNFFARWQTHSSPGGWHRLFDPNLRSYTYETVPTALPKHQYNMIEHVEPEEYEKLDYNTNLQFWVFKKLCVE